MTAPTRLILGTAGHIDHGKTSLVRALTGVDTDRLAEEKERGITIELGFARYGPTAEASFGIVDVPGHEGFIKTMLAGATGMDIVLLVVAADEGVMPQTREHLSIVRLLGIDRMVVALTKSDLVEEEWLELVTEDVRELLSGSPYQGSEIVPTSVETGEGLEELSRALSEGAAGARRRSEEDLMRLPVDRVFTVEGAGTVVTGTLWSGRLGQGETVRILPRDDEARVRAVQVHGGDVRAAGAGQRTAVALTGAAVRRGLVERGDVLVSHPSWKPSMMLTVSLETLPDTGWQVEAGQRVRVHLGTVEVMARLVLFGEERIAPGGRAVAQLRLEGGVVARAGDRFVVRSYSPMTTIAGGVVLEPSPPKRKRLSDADREALGGVREGGESAIQGAVALAGWQGVPVSELGVRAGWVSAAPDPLPPGLWRLADTLFASSVVEEGERRILQAVEGHHRRRPLDAGAPLEVLRGALPGRADGGLADGISARLAEAGRVVITGKRARLPEFQPSLTPEDSALEASLARILRAAGLQGPAKAELPPDLAGNPRIDAVLGYMADQGKVLLLGDAYWVWTEALDEATTLVRDRLSGRTGLGPADFREVLPVTRKHLIPILTYLDGKGITRRRDDGREVVGSA